MLGGRDARTLAREILQMTQAEFSTAFKGSLMRRAKLGGLKRNAALVLGNVGTREDVDVLTRALDGYRRAVQLRASAAAPRSGSAP